MKLFPSSPAMVDRISLYMEALTAVQVALITIYEVCKAIDSGMAMGDIKLLEKSK